MLRLAFGVMTSTFFFQTSAFAQALHPAEQEFQLYHSVVAGLQACPAAMEDWELAQIRSYRDNAREALVRIIDQNLSPQGVRTLTLRGASIACDDPQLTREAAELRTFVHHNWYVNYKAMTAVPVCQAVLDRFGAPLSDQIEAFATTIKKQLPGTPQSEAILEDQAAKLALRIAPECPKDEPLNLDTPELRLVKQALARPIFSGEKRAHDPVRRRYFDATFGYTIDLGETRTDGGHGRPSSVLAERHRESSENRVIVANNACGHYSPDPDIVTVGSCKLRLSPTGELIIRSTDEHDNTEAILRAYDPATGEVIKDVRASQESEGLMAVWTFSDGLNTLQELPPLTQINVMLERDDGTEDKMLSENTAASYPKTVALMDLRRAFSFAYAGDSQDLTIGGLTEPFYTLKRAQLDG